ncbi:hypothetical protein GH733_017272 [Mirounga leonina]|nr:hypothetical protein GH733_017272 [Mirounga leonina]
MRKDYGAALRGLCEDALEGLLFLLLFSLLSAGALATTLCSLPRAWALFPPRSGGEGGVVLGGGGAGWTPGPLLGQQPPDRSPIRLLCHSHRPPVTTMTMQMMTTLSTLRYRTRWSEGGGQGPVIQSQIPSIPPPRSPQSPLQESKRFVQWQSSI